MVFTEEQLKYITPLLPKITGVTNRHVTFLDESGEEMRISPAQFVKNFDKNKIISTGNAELITLVMTNITAFRTMLTSYLDKLAREFEKKNTGEIPDYVKSLKTLLRSFTPCVNILNPEEIILMDDEYRRSFYSAELLETTVGMEKEDIYARAYYARFDYNPRRFERTYTEKIGHEEIPCLNTYLPPSWMEVEVENPQIPPLIDKFMRHLFPIDDERDYVYDWLHKSLTDRAYVYLLLNGEKKTGKNTFKFLFKALHGITNSVDGKKSTLTTQFNGQLSECRAIIFDEIKYSEEEENIMKEIQNDNVAIERKGVDATRGGKIHCSMLLLNNDAKDNYISVDSRRFSPMSVTDVPLLKAMTEEEISEMVEKVKEDSPDYDPQFLANFGHWILEHGRNYKWKKEQEYIGPKFYELVQTSLSEWRRFTLKVVEDVRKSGSGHRYRLSEIEEKFYKKLGTKSAKKYPDYGRVINFLKHYRDINGQVAVEYEKLEDQYDFYVYPAVREGEEEVVVESNLSAFKSRKEEAYDDGL